MNFGRVWAIFLRQFFLIRKSSHRIIGIFYWSVLELFVWGALTIYLDRVGNAGFSFVAAILGAVILWNLLFRIQYGITVSFLEDVWTRNLVNLFASPLKLSEYVMGLIATSFIETVLAFVFLSGISIIFLSYSIFQFGFYLTLFFAVLFLFGWALGIFATAVILRLGPSSEILAWSLPVFITPFSGVSYPISTLPESLRPIARLLPTAQVFEGMREMVLLGTFNFQNFFMALVSSIIFLVISYVFLLRAYKSVLKKGTLVRFMTD